MRVGLLDDAETNSLSSCINYIYLNITYAFNHEGYALAPPKMDTSYPFDCHTQTFFFCVSVSVFYGILELCELYILEYHLCF